MTLISERQDFKVDLYFYSQSDGALHRMNILINESSKVDDTVRDGNPLKVFMNIYRHK